MENFNIGDVVCFDNIESEISFCTKENGIIYYFGVPLGAQGIVEVSDNISFLFVRFEGYKGSDNSGRLYLLPRHLKHFSPKFFKKEDKDTLEITAQMEGM